MQYKCSKYNIMTSYKGQYLWFNQISKAVLLSSTINLNKNDPFLYDQGFITNSDEKDLEKAENNFIKAICDDSHMNLTIIPTMQCDLRCVYCYETEYHTNSCLLTEDIVLGIANEIKNNQKLKSIHINWNGGEPTLAINMIYKTSKLIQEICSARGIEYSASISSNLYNTDDNVFQKLLRSGILKIETTLAGTNEIHDKYRRSSANFGTFNRVWNNIINALNYNFFVTICINVTAENIDQIILLLNQIQNIKHNNLFVTFLAVENYGYGNDCIYIAENKQIGIMIKLLNYAINLGLKAEINSNFGCKYIFCSSQHKNSYIIDPNGYLYKCVNYYSVGNSVGHVEKNGFLLYDNNKVINPYIDEKCKLCEILPYCNGGCNYKRSMGKDPCPLEKDYLDQLLASYVDNYLLTNDKL